MSEMERSEAELDRRLRRSMAAPVPRLPADFHQAVSRELRRRSDRLDRHARVLLAAYGVLSALTCMVVMRGQGLGWELIAAVTLGPLAMVEAARRLGRKRGVSAD